MEDTPKPVFAKKASGLVREAGLVDAIYFGIMNNAVPVSIWLTLTAYAWLPGANLFIAGSLTLVLIVFGTGLSWGILGGSMPRSGGSYVYNSRILHPAIGMAVSFCNAGLVMLAWIWVLAPWIGEVGIPMLVGSLELDPQISELVDHGWGLYLVATAANASAFCVVLLGMKRYFRLQKWLVTWGLIGAAVAGYIFVRTSSQEFAEAWDTYSGQVGSLSWEETLKRYTEVTGGISDGWNWRSTIGLMLPVSWIAIYGYIITFIGGEVRQPRKNILRAQLLNPIISVLFLLAVGWSYMAMVGWEGIHVLAWISEEGLEGIKLPFEVSYITIAALVAGFNRILGFIMSSAFILADWLWVVFSYIAWSRAATAWGIDRLGPRWFTETSDRFNNQPVKVLTLLFLLSQLLLFHYCWNPEILGSISVEVLQLVSVFGITAFSAVVFPFIGRVGHIWESSPFREWKVLGLPVCTWAGLVSLALTALLVIAYYINEAFAFMHTPWTLIYLGSWLFGLVWYFGWRAVRARQGINIDLAYRQLPPE